MYKISILDFLKTGKFGDIEFHFSDNEENYSTVNIDDTFTSIGICNKLENGEINE